MGEGGYGNLLRNDPGCIFHDFRSQFSFSPVQNTWNRYTDTTDVECFGCIVLDIYYIFSTGSSIRE
jgi:hypothetical protein